MRSRGFGVAVAVSVPLSVAALFAQDTWISPIQAKPPEIEEGRLQMPRLRPPRDTVLAAAAPTESLFRNAMGAPEGTDVLNAEKIKIRFQGYADLSGEYRVRSDESISIPVLGRVPLAGMTQSDLEVALASRLRSTTGRDAYVTVEISEYRPVFVAGQAQRPGAFPWRPGMTVLQALALAGGTFRATGRNDEPFDLDVEVVRLQKAVSDQKRYLATFARLQAERNGNAEIEVPAALVDLVGREEAKSLIAAQATLMESRRSAYLQERASLDVAMQQANSELRGLAELQKRSKGHVKLRSSNMERLESLQARGLVPVQKSVDERMKVSEIEDKEQVLKVSSAHVQVMLARLARERIQVDQLRLTLIDEEMLRLESKIAHLDIEISSARRNYTKLTGQEPPLSLTGSDGPRKVALKYGIVRKTPTGSINVEATQTTAMKAGDTLVVSLD